MDGGNAGIVGNNPDGRRRVPSFFGSSIVMTVQSGPKLFGMPLSTVLGLLGYLIAFVNSVWIVVSIWRATRD